MNKRGALELSVNTIIVIVIGVTILTLGLYFVQNIFGGLDELGTGAIQQAKSQLVDLGNVDKLLSVSPKETDISQGDTGYVRVNIANIEEIDYKSVKASVKSTSKDVVCVFTDTLQQTSETWNINSGKKVAVDIGINVGKNAKLGNVVCNVEVSSLDITESDKSDSLFVNVVK